MARLADPQPYVCSVCLQPPMVRDHTLRYVDFEAAHEGPVLTRYGERVDSGQTIPVSIDDIIICEECLRAGAGLIGMADADQIREEMQAVTTELAEARAELKAKDAALGDMEHTIGVVIDHPVKRAARHPKIVGPEDKAEELTKVRSNRRTAAKISKTMKEKQA